MTTSEQVAPEAPEGVESASWIGRVIDERYKVEQLLGQGGMGAVFLAEHVKLQKKVALKVILPQFAGNGEVAERFAREAMASAKLEHPHVASALDYGTLPEGGAYLVMQFARGPSLRRVEDEDANKRNWRYACEVGAQIADALSAAHAAGIVHRDLKPENVILEPRDDGSELVKVLDFGIARVIDSAGEATGLTKLTRVGTIIGTPGYMSPEQALGETVDARADLYALGVILWEVCAGRELWGGEHEITALVTKQLTTEPAHINTIATDVPAELDALIHRLLARDKNERPERAGEVRDVLRRIAFTATVERMSTSGASGPYPIPASVSGAYSAVPLPTVSTPSRPSLLDQIPPDVAKQLGSLAPRLMQPPLVFVVVGVAALFSLLVLVSLVMVCSSGPPATTVVTAPVPSTSVGQREHVEPIPHGVEPPPSTHAPVVEGAIPEAFAADFQTLVSEGGRTARRDAAERILAQPQDVVPPVVWLVARLEDESGCEIRREIVTSLGALGDPRALPPLERIDHNRRGCGFLRSQDCYRCLRSQLATTLTTLRSR
jgi:serine/threonine-protein kinase